MVARMGDSSPRLPMGKTIQMPWATVAEYRDSAQTSQCEMLHVTYCVKLFCSGFRIHPKSGEDMKGGRVYSNLHASTSSKTNVQETSPPRQRFSRHSSTERLETVRSGIPGFLEESSKLHSRGRSSGGQRASMNGELCASPCSRHLVHKLPD